MYKVSQSPTVHPSSCLTCLAKKFPSTSRLNPTFPPDGNMSPHHIAPHRPISCTRCRQTPSNLRELVCCRTYPSARRAPSHPMHYKAFFNTTVDVEKTSERKVIPLPAAPSQPLSSSLTINVTLHFSLPGSP